MQHIQQIPENEISQFLEAVKFVNSIYINPVIKIKDVGIFQAPEGDGKMFLIEIESPNTKTSPENLLFALAVFYGQLLERAQSTI